mmetsp:Transcript_6728/g.6036  ORF Transcript_6728/g.6036 Transcript_6728/m.6036 type:complete len:97 (+) Transcript_6728:419-709(+)
MVSLAIFNKFWLHSGRGNLKEKAPIIESNISKWEKTYMVTKSKTLTKDDLRLLHQLPNEENTLLFKVYSAIVMAYAARGCEIAYLTFNQMILVSFI